MDMTDDQERLHWSVAYSMLLILMRTEPAQLLKKNAYIILTFIVSHELQVFLVEVNEDASSVLLTHVGNARHVEHVLGKLVLHEKNVMTSSSENNVKDVIIRSPETHTTDNLLWFNSVTNQSYDYIFPNETLSFLTNTVA